MTSTILNMKLAHRQRKALYEGRKTTDAFVRHGTLGGPTISGIKILLLSFIYLFLAVGPVQGQRRDHKFLPTGQSGSLEVVKHTHFALGYYEDHEQAAWVAYQLTSGEVNKGKEYKAALGELYKRSFGKRAYKEDTCVSIGSALDEDYDGKHQKLDQKYERGHLAPVADMRFSVEAAYERDFMSNISPQQPTFNRGIWGDLEDKFREWAVSAGSIYVVTGPVLDEILGKIGRKKDVSVPGWFYKIGYSSSDGCAMGFLLKNEGSEDSLSNFIVTVNEIEKRTGLDFKFQPGKSEEKNEGQKNKSCWGL